MYKYTICEPLNPIIVDKGEVSADAFREVMKSFPWLNMLREFETSNEADICFPPSLTVVDTQSNHSLEIAIVGPETDLEFYITYKRPKKIEKLVWFEKAERFNRGYATEKTGQSAQDVEDAINALLDANFSVLESRWGGA